MSTGNDNFSQFNNPSPYAYSTVPLQETELTSNGWGLAGFITSLVGLFICGIPSLVGVILSLVGLGRNPKGLAIAGLIIGLVGLVELLLLIVVTMWVGYQSNLIIKTGGTYYELSEAGKEIQAEWRNISRVPNQAEGDKIIEGRRDSFGSQLIYEPSEDSFTIRSSGIDRIQGTKDDFLIPFFTPDDEDLEMDEDEDEEL